MHIHSKEHKFEVESLKKHRIMFQFLSIVKLKKMFKKVSQFLH